MATAFIVALPGHCFAVNANEQSFSSELTSEPTLVDPRPFDKLIRFEIPESWEDHRDTDLPPNNEFVIQALRQNDIEKISEHDLEKPETFEKVGPSQFLAFILTDRILLRSGPGNEVKDDGSVEGVSLADQNYDQLMKAGYKVYESRLAHDPQELKLFLEIANFALSPSTVLGSKGPIYFDFQGHERAVARRVGQLITSVLPMRVLPRLYVKMQVTNRGVIPAYDWPEFARAFFSNDLTSTDRQVAADMDALHTHSLSLREWLELCVKALAPNDQDPNQVSAVFDFASTRLSATRAKYPFRHFRDADRKQVLEAIHRLIVLAPEMTDVTVQAAISMIAQVVDQSIFSSLNQQRAFDSEINRVLNEIPKNSQLMLTLRKMIAQNLTKRAAREFTENTPISARWIRLAIIYSNKNGNKFGSGLSLKNASFCQRLLRRSDWTPRFTKNFF